jgi:hypothetical protein
MTGWEPEISVDEPPIAPVGEAFVLPGANFEVLHPALFWPTQILLQRGWRIIRARWTWTAEAADDPWRTISQTLARMDGHALGLRRVYLAKSVGTRAAEAAAAEGAPGIWMTPLTSDPRVMKAIRSCPRSLLVAGTRDETWRHGEELRERHEICEIPGMTHGMLVPGSWRSTLRGLEQINETVEAFTDRLL